MRCEQSIVRLSSDLPIKQVQIAPSYDEKERALANGSVDKGKQLQPGDIFVLESARPNEDDYCYPAKGLYVCNGRRESDEKLIITKIDANAKETKEVVCDKGLSYVTVLGRFCAIA